ncbi:EI24 domain-containing protein [Telmatospirillum sp.]|uniref:EI24 domain-containing protein n=1 Tax=Telmatospirillum sp. TaxID=2079197 RepID=UPI002849968D|nr:EI24 domain-containing protein [Telmatospirillum sp.]MDR3440724.1 EI24 domain-containing protein [Telmatospirillum sp.]
MIASLAKAIAQLSDPRFRRVLLIGLSTTFVTYLLVYAAVGWGLSGLHVWGIGWADTITDLLGGLAIFVIALILFPSVATLVLGFLQDEIATAVEARYYPALPAPRHQGLIEIGWGALRFAAVALLVNLLALPIYLLLLVAGIGAALYCIVNGYLLARDYFEMAAWRRLEPAAADRLRRRHWLRLWLLGIVLALVSTLPLVNLLAPLIATAAMVHEVEKLRSKDA